MHGDPARRGSIPKTRLERLELLEAILKGTRDIEAGDLYEAEAVMEEMEEIVRRHEKAPRPAARPGKRRPERNR